MTTFKASCVALLCSSMFLTSSCKKDDSTVCSANSFPFLEVGHQMVYHYEPSLFTNEDTATVTIDSKQSDDNYKLTYTFIHNPLFNSSAYYFACNEKIYGGSSPLSEANDYFISTNTNVGDSWTRSASGGSSVVVEHSLLSKTETVVVPAGTFSNCWKITYHQQGKINTDTIFWRHDIGYVKYTGALEYYLISKNF